MKWFERQPASKLSDEERSLAVYSMTEGYVQRVRIRNCLLGMEPLLSPMEMAVLWMAAASQMRKSKLPPLAKETACAFFDSWCQNYIDWISEEGAKITLNLRSWPIKKNITITLKSMGVERVKQAASILGAETGSAEHMAVNLRLILSQERTQQIALFEQIKEAASSRTDLTQQERGKILELIEDDRRAL